MRYLSVDAVLEIHEECVKFNLFANRDQINSGILSIGNLEYVVIRVEDYDENVEDALFWKAVILLEGIVSSKGHPFIDGNKRTGFEALKTFLSLNGYSFNSEKEKIIEFLREIAEGKKNIYSIKEWVKKNSAKSL